MGHHQSILRTNHEETPITASSFVTEHGTEVPAVTAHQMRQIDRIAVDHTGPVLFQMMENAGRNLASAVIDQISAESASTPILVLAGTGGNGGGGICAARHLANRGAQVTLVVSNPDDLDSVPGQQLVTFAETDGVLARPEDLERVGPGVIVDALIGYSLRREPRGTIKELIDWVATTSAAVISLDVPSGIDASSGESYGSHIVASETLTLALPKTGLDAAVVGRLTLADIGIPAGVYRRAGIEVPEGLFSAGYRVGLTPSKPNRAVD